VARPCLLPLPSPSMPNTDHTEAATDAYLDDENLVTALVPSEMACLESSPGRMSRTEVWISRDEMVDRWLYEASLEASEAIRSKMSETNELRMAMALLLRVSRSLAFSSRGHSRDTGVGVDLLEDLVDVRRVGLDPLLGSLLATLGLGGGGLGGLKSASVKSDEGRVGSP